MANINNKKNDTKNTGPDLVQKVKGFRDIMGSEYWRMKGAIERAEDVALYYGFSPLEIPTVEYTNIFERTQDTTDASRSESGTKFNTSDNTSNLETTTTKVMNNFGTLADVNGVTLVESQNLITTTGDLGTLITTEYGNSLIVTNNTTNVVITDNIRREATLGG